MKPVTVLIIDDSAVIRHLFREMLADAPGIDVVGVASDAYEAREKIKQLNPQVLTLDIEMPGMDGLSFLEKVMSLRPMPVVMVSTLTQKGAGATFKALELGAVDYISKPVASQDSDALRPLRQELIEKITAAAQANLQRRVMRPVQKEPVVLGFRPHAGIGGQLIAIGSSTGGVEALPGNLPPIVITQHMPPTFTTSFAARLDGLSQVAVHEAQDGMVLEQGHAYLAPGGLHLKVVRKGRQLMCRVEEGDPVSGHRPSVDVLFHSVAETVGPHALGVILTGMGKDGANGLHAMRQRGAYTIGQDQASCVVYGMPKAAKAIGAVITELPLAEIAQHMLGYCEKEISHAL
jgi:two-component system chemotaxis response regulator CheB